MGEAVKTTGGGVGESVPPLQQAAEGRPAGAAAAVAGEGADTATATVEEWYKNSGGSALHQSTLVNADGLKLSCYHWDPEKQHQQRVRGKVVLVHGYAVHARFEYLRHDLKEPQAPPRYEGSWIQRLAAAGFSVHALDQQSFGASEGLKGKRAHFLDFDALPRDIIQFLHEQVLPAHDAAAPIYLCGISMGGCAIARAAELLAGGHYRSKCSCCNQPPKCSCSQAAEAVTGESGKPAAGDAGTTETGKDKNKETAHVQGGGGPAAEGKAGEEQKQKHKKQGEQPQQHKVLLPLKGLICLAPMFALDRMKKKNRLVLPFAKLLATISPTLEVASAAKNPIYPAFDVLMKNDPLAYNRKSRARLSYELLYAVSAVQQQAHYLALPDAAALTPHSPQPFPVYIDAAPALLIVETKNDTFVDPEGSVYVAAVVNAKMEGSAETLAKYKPYYDSVRASSKPTGHPDATLWMLDDLWHCFTKEVPESDALLDRIINDWLVPHAAAAGSCAAPPPQQLSDKGKAEGACPGAGACGGAAKCAEKAAEATSTATARAGGEETAGAPGTQASPRAEKHRKHKKEKTGGTGGGGAEDADAEAAGAANEQETKLPLTPAVSNASDKRGGADTAVKEKGEEQKGDLQPAEQDTPAGAAAEAAAETAAVEKKTDARLEESADYPVATGAAAPNAVACEVREAAAESQEKATLEDEQQQDTQEQPECATEEEPKAEEQQEHVQETGEDPAEPQADTATAAEQDTVAEAAQQQPQAGKEEAEHTQEVMPVENSEQEACPAVAEQDNGEAAAPEETENTDYVQE